MEKFIGSIDLLHCLGDIIKNRQLLYSLCLTSKTFKEYFTPFLYRRLDVHLVWGDGHDINADWVLWAGYDAVTEEAPIVKALRLMLSNPNLKHVRELYISGSCLAEDSTYIDEAPADLPGLQIKLLCQLVTKMGRLKHIRFDARFFVSLLPMMSSFPQLFDSIVFNCADVFDGRVEPFRPRIATSFKSLSCLRSLSLTRLGCTEVLSVADMVEVLLANPLLEDLAIEYGYTDTFDSLNPNHHVDPQCPSNAVNFLHSICYQYREGGGRPLKLKRLQVASYLPSTSDLQAIAAIAAGSETEAIPDGNAVAALYLDWLCDISKLEEVGYQDIDVHYSYRGAHTENRMAPFARFAWQTFTVQRAPRLRRVRFWEFNDDFTDWLKRDVAPPDGYGNRVTLSSNNGFARNGFDGTKELRTVAGHLNGTWKPTELELYFDKHVEHARNESEALFGWITENGDSLEALTIFPDLLTSETNCGQWASHLRKLPNLRILQLARPEYKSEDIPNGFVDLRFRAPNFELLGAIVSRCFSLRYIKTGEFAWSIIRPQRQDPPSGCRVRQAIVLQPLERAEQEEIELFRFIPDNDEHMMKHYDEYYNPFGHPAWKPTPGILINEGTEVQFKLPAEKQSDYTSLTKISMWHLSAWCDQQAQALDPTLQRHSELVGQLWMDSHLQELVAREIANSRLVADNRRSNGQWRLRFETIEELEELVPAVAQWKFRSERGGGEALVGFCRDTLDSIYASWENANRDRWHSSMKPQPMPQ